MLLTFDGRTVVGKLSGFDQSCNVVLEKSVERVFCKGQLPKTIGLGLFVVRGDNVAVIGQLDDEREAASQWASAKVRNERRGRVVVYVVDT